MPIAGDGVALTPQRRRASLNGSPRPSYVTSAGHASSVVTPSPVARPLANAAVPCARSSATDVRKADNAGDGKDVPAVVSTPMKQLCEGMPPDLCCDVEGDHVPRLEELVVMTAALMKPYPLLCRGLGGNSQGCSSSVASRVVDRQAHITTSDPRTVRPNLQCLLFDEPPPGVSAAVAASYPAKWFPTIVPCFDEGLLYRIEWRRRGSRRLPGETDDGANVVWCFYNGTPCYEMDIAVSFEEPAERATVPLRGWGATVLSSTEGLAPGSVSVAHHPEMLARTVCPPLSTVGFIMGRVGAFRTSIRGVPVSAAPMCQIADPAPGAVADDDAQQGLSSEDGLRLALRERRRFVDPEFPPTNASLQGGLPEVCSPSLTRGAALVPANWLRTPDIVARLVGVSCVPLTRLHQPLIPDIDPLFIEPGELGDSWLVGAMAAVAEHPSVMLRMFRHPKSTEHAKMERAIGAFRLTLNVQGWWRSVVVDDFLPVTVGNYPKYAHSRRDLRELWMELLEKAFAKLHDGYANIVAGDPLDALRVLTGWPCARYDITNFKDIAFASSAFASRLRGYDRHGLQIIFHTAPQLSPVAHHASDAARAGTAGSSITDPSVSLDEERTSARGGLLPGMVYAVLQMLHFGTNSYRAELTLLQVRNVWGDVAAWRGRWRCGSPRWAKWPKVAEACKMPPHPTHPPQEGTVGPDEDEAVRAPQPTDCVCHRQQFFWIEWGEVCQYFSGCGVMFRLALHHDYRVRGVFEGVRPSVCLRVTVTSRCFIALTLSMQDTKDVAPGMDDGGAASARPPIMISLAQEQDGVLHVVRNSQIDPDYPSPLFTFMQASEVSLLSLLTPENSPYWVIPRILASAPDAYLNGVAPPPVCHPYVLGYFQNEPAGVGGGARVEFVQLPEDSPAFQNSTRFAVSDGAQPVEAMFQAKAPQASFPNTYIHTELSEEGGVRADEDFDTIETACCMSSSVS